MCDKAYSKIGMLMLNRCVFIGSDIEQLTLTQPYDLIIFPSTVQWLHHKAAFLAKCAQHLNVMVCCYLTLSPNNNGNQHINRVVYPIRQRPVATVAETLLCIGAFIHRNHPLTI